MSLRWGNSPSSYGNSSRSYDSSPGSYGNSPSSYDGSPSNYSNRSSPGGNRSSSYRNLPSTYDDCMNWMVDKKSTLEKVKYAKNRRNIQKGFEEQNQTASEIQEFGQQVDKVVNRTYDEEKKQKLTDAYAQLKEVSEKKIHCLTTMLGIATLEENCGTLSHDMDRKAAELVGPEDRARLADLAGEHIRGFISPDAQDCIFGVKDNWEWIVKLVKCVDIHLKNGSHYHQFFHEVEETAGWLEDDLAKLQQTFDDHKLEDDPDNAHILIKALENTAVSLKQWESKVDHLWTKANKVVPVHLRTEGVKGETPARALVDYETDEISIREDEDILLLDNSDSQTWRVRNCRGVEGDVPALTVLIPGPYKDAIDSAVKMRLKLLTCWTNTIKRLGKKVICHMLSVFRPEYNEDEISSLKSMKRLDKQEMTRILDFIEDTLKKHWSDHEGFISLQERILALRMMVESVGDDGLADEKVYTAILLQISNLEQLMQKYKDLWENWECYKTAVEASRAPDLMLIVDKWEQLQFVTKAYFSKFWQNQLPLEDFERSLLNLRTLAVEGVQVEDVHHHGTKQQVFEQLPEMHETNKVESREVVYQTTEKAPLNRAQMGQIDVTLALGGAPAIVEDVGFNDSRVVETKTVTLQQKQQERAPPPPPQRARMAQVSIQDALGQDELTEDSGSSWSDSRTVETTVEVEKQQPMYRARSGKVDMMDALGGANEEGMSETRVKETQWSVTGGRDRGRGSGEEGFNETKVRATKVNYVNGTIQSGQEMFEEGLVEEGVSEVVDRGSAYSNARVSHATQEGTDFGRATLTRTAETEQLENIEVDERKLFVIRSVVTPGDDVEISLQQAILEGIICPNKGVYYNHATDSEMPIPSAMAEGLIKVEFTSTRRGVERRSTIGIITVKTIREPQRPYVIKTVEDTKTGQKLTQKEAAAKDILDEKRGIYVDTKKSERILLSEAIDQGLVTVDYIGEAPPQEIESKTYAVRAVVDRRWKRTVTFAEAVRRGIIDKETGAYRDTMSGESMYVGDAIMRGYLKARKIDNPASLDIDPQNKVLIDRTEMIKKKLLSPLKVISAFKTAGRIGAKKRLSSSSSTGSN